MTMDQIFCVVLSLSLSLIPYLGREISALIIERTPLWCIMYKSFALHTQSSLTVVEHILFISKVPCSVTNVFATNLFVRISYRRCSRTFVELVSQHLVKVCVNIFILPVVCPESLLCSSCELFGTPSLCWEILLIVIRRKKDMNGVELIYCNRRG